MLEINRILIQLNKAVDAANSEFPQEKGIAVILFDNLIELQLLNRAKTLFSFDVTNCYNGNRKFNFKTRLLNNYDLLLKFSKNNGIINIKDFDILKYVHSIRNSVYHQGKLNSLTLDLAILIYYDLINRYILKWGSSNVLVCITSSPGYEKINFGQNLEESNAFTDYRNYFNNATCHILSKLNIRSQLNEKVQNILYKQIEKIKTSIEFINTRSKNINFYCVLGKYWYLNDEFLNFHKAGRKPKNLNSILLLYEFLREKKEYLDDIEDLKKRQTEGKKLLRKYRSHKKGKYSCWTDIKKIEKQIVNLILFEPNALLNKLIEIENKIANFYTDLDNASSDLDGYIQQSFDFVRGK
ncbi:hypothetical protein SDC9_68631 [bioreactor metagenome]|uniref:Uncharacterized protein n=1 Tax=bioreactor metagenome TaxID=1076179 RepID=A0A644Y0Y7_9ZZZZ